MKLKRCGRQIVLRSYANACRASRSSIGTRFNRFGIHVVITDIRRSGARFVSVAVSIDKRVVRSLCKHIAIVITYGNCRNNRPSRINIAVLGQSHCFKDIEGTALKPTHTAVPEGYVLGFENTQDKVLGIQFHPESGPGPYDNISLFDKFIKMMEDNRNA